MTRYGAILSRELDLKGWSQQQLASAIGVSRSAVGKWADGTNRPKGPTRRAVASALGVSFDLMEREAGFVSMRAAATAPVGIPVINRAEAGVATNYINDQYEGGEYHNAWEYIDRGGIDDPLAFAVEVAERSMEPTLIGGDRIVLRPVTDDAGSPGVEDGAMVFVRLSGDAPGDLAEHCTIARWRALDDEQVMLSKDNPTHAPIVVKLEHVSRVARAAEIRRKL